MLGYFCWSSFSHRPKFFEMTEKNVRTNENNNRPIKPVTAIFATTLKQMTNMSQQKKHVAVNYSSTRPETSNLRNQLLLTQRPNMGKHPDELWRSITSGLKVASSAWIKAQTKSRKQSHIVYAGIWPEAGWKVKQCYSSWRSLHKRFEKTKNCLKISQSCGWKWIC